MLTAYFSETHIAEARANDEKGHSFYDLIIAGDQGGGIRCTAIFSDAAGKQEKAYKKKYPDATYVGEVKEKRLMRNARGIMNLDKWPKWRVTHADLNPGSHCC